MRVCILKEKLKKTGRTSLVLDIEVASKRTKKALGLYFKTNPTTESERKERKEKLALATQIAREKERELLSFRHDLPEQYHTEADFLSYAWGYIEAQKGLVGMGRHIAVVKKLQTFFKAEVHPLLRSE